MKRLRAWLVAFIASGLVSEGSIDSRAKECAPMGGAQQVCAAPAGERLLMHDEELHQRPEIVHLASADVEAVATPTAAAPAFFDDGSMPAPPFLLRRRTINPAIHAMLNQGDELPPGFRFGPTLPE